MTNWSDILKRYKECEICAREQDEYDMREVKLKNPKMHEWLKQQRILNVPDNKDTVRICSECIRGLNPEIKRKRESGDFD